MQIEWRGSWITSTYQTGHRMSKAVADVQYLAASFINGNVYRLVEAEDE